MPKLILAALLMFSLLEGSTPEEIIRARLNAWPQDLKEKNLSSACSLFAPDLVAVYQGIPDRNYKEMCAQLEKVMGKIAYAAPDIEEILIDKDIAVVRLTWTLATGEKERGLDVFQKQPDGDWKIRISYAFPI